MAEASSRKPMPPRDDGVRKALPYALALGMCIVTTIVASTLAAYLDLANTIMLFLLTVVLVAVYLGRAPAIVSAVASVALFDFFFVPPRFSFTVADVQYVVTFAVMLVVALVISHLTGGLKRQALDSERRERETRALYDLARQLAGTASLAQVEHLTQDWVRTHTGADIVLLTRGSEGDGKLTRASEPTQPDWLVLRSAETVVSSGRVVASDQLGDDRNWLLLPLTTAVQIYGVLAIAAPLAARDLLKAQRPILDALASLVTSTVERLHFVAAAQVADVRASTERLRSSVLSAISHDVRTPLTTMHGLADRLSLMQPPLPDPAHASVLAIRDQSQRLCGMVANLLDMARLQAGEVRLRKEWQPLEEVIGASIQALGPALREHAVKVELEPDLPLLEFDAVLMERVFGNLLENAAKYAPRGTPITIGARTMNDVVEVTVADEGPGFPPDRIDDVFELFTRATPESAVPGMGVGLAICHAVVKAHGGDIRAINRAAGGACIAFTLPRGTPPEVRAEPSATATSP
jgi:two-component system sensor histidine kinase KdpD